MPDDSCICFENIHENHIRENNGSKDYTFVLVINKIFLADLFYDVRRKK
jgi:hypothetical protein